MAAAIPPETSDGTVTSWMPLTTSFASVQGCSDSYMLEGSRLVAFDPGYGLSINEAVACQPRAVTSWWNQALLGVNTQDHTALSLGPLQCPDDWNTVATSVVDQTSTQVMCCPPGYSLENGIRGQIAGDCQSGVAAGSVITYASTPDFQSLSWTMTSTTLEDSSTVGAIAVVGWNVSPLSDTATSTESSTSSSSTEPSASVTDPTASSTPTNLASPPSDGLSTGAKAGIGVGVALGVLGLIALVVAILLIRRRKMRSAKAGSPYSGYPTTKSELPSVSSPVASGQGDQPKGHHFFPPRSEMDAAPRPAPMHEMPG